MSDTKIKKRLEHLRKQLRGECISMGELHELQSLAAHIDPDDVELLEPAGVPEFSGRRLDPFMRQFVKDKPDLFPAAWEWIKDGWELEGEPAPEQIAAALL